MKALSSTLGAVALAFSVTTAALAVAGLALLAAPAAHAGGSAEVRYTQPERYTDAGRSAVERERTMHELTAWLQTLAQRLPDGQSLQIEITDIDRAGIVEPRGVQEVRIARGGADWPRLALHYTLLDRGRTVKSGDARLSDMNYLYDRRPSARDQGDLVYEKRMVRQWFERTFEAAN